MDFEEEPVATLEKIDNLKLLNEKQEQHNQASKNLFATRLTKSIKKREAEIKSLKE